ncbi:BZ3500_MvSof-1268-A1-R1_Chr8-1g09802 [Microbotryum saponariae]|uniref:BZ3500_MvSof-1268-A1-R1_Chr8-1g09802 protein n=1 Tax=Microbotryum saponariae TaxID=289078 RepID=A0A2X0LRI1_9BASI|nr:BZ3500_MvSof-1268-A1-R1_Chr8-1g09802 [Microbotryum saponariae]SDA08088.1 BZ3501_MvSof-1269-A2-R1_Chr8-1g09525 [Microbotryum saponariae]
MITRTCAKWDHWNISVVRDFHHTSGSPTLMLLGTCKTRPQHHQVSKMTFARASKTGVSNWSEVKKNCEAGAEKNGSVSWICNVRTVLFKHHS